MIKKLITGLIALSLLLTLWSVKTEFIFAQTDPDYQIEVATNTICSFINGDNVNVRQNASLQSPVVARLNRGDGVRALGRTGDWVQIAALDSGIPPTPYTPLQGYVFNKYINGCSEDQFERWRR